VTARRRVGGAAAAFTAAVGLGLTAGVASAATAPASASPPDLTANAPVTTDPVPAGEVAVVAASAPVNDRIAFVVQNGTDGTVRVARVTAFGTRAGGTQVSRATTRSVVPVRLAPGERAIGRVRFRANSIGPAPELTWEVRSTQAPAVADPTRLAVLDPVLSPPQGGAVAQTLDLTVENPQARARRGPVVTKVLCLNEAGRPAVLVSKTTKRARVAAGATVPVTVKLRELCPSWAVGAATGTSR